MSQPGKSTSLDRSSKEGFLFFLMSFLLAKKTKGRDKRQCTLDIGYISLQCFVEGPDHDRTKTECQGEN